MGISKILTYVLPKLLFLLDFPLAGTTTLRHKSGKKLVPELRDAGRIQAVRLPAKPSVGEVIGLAVAGDHGCILHFEVQVIKGDGKMIPLGSIQRMMRESIEAAVQYVRFKSVELELSQDWYENLDVAVLATYMGVPKEGIISRYYYCHRDRFGTEKAASTQRYRDDR